MRTVQALTLEEAKAIADGAEAKAIELEVKIAIAIMDEHGNLKYYRRMDGNNVISVRMSQLKALTSTSIPISTKALGERNAPLPNKPYSSVPGIVLLEGGLPIITKEGQHVGSIGISGATPEIDGICAQAGLDKIKHLLR
jgi:glc operon protein GlcG